MQICWIPPQKQLSQSHTAHADVQAGLEIGIEAERVCDILAGDHLHIFGYYCTVSVLVYMPPFCSFPCKGMEAGIPC